MGPLESSKIFRFVLTISLVLGFGTSLAQAAFVVPGLPGAADSDGLDLAQRAHINHPSHLHKSAPSQEQLQLSLDDAFSRVGKELSIPPRLKETVWFWSRIYSEFSSLQIVLHDDLHPELIYDVVDLRPIQEKAKSPYAFSRLRIRAITQAHRRFDRAFLLLERSKTPAARTRLRKKNSEVEKILIAHEKLDKKHRRHSWKAFREQLHLQPGLREHVIRGILDIDPYLPEMESIFEEFRIPSPLVRIALVESSFNLDAISKVGATGVWQFMPDSGREFLRVNQPKGIDERLSPLKSTVAAARLLYRNKFMLKNWPLAITAYNHGFTGLIGRKIRRLKPDEVFKLFELCNDASPLGWASRNYFSEFLAMVHVEAYRDILLGLPDRRPGKALAIRFHPLESAQSPAAFAVSNNIPYIDFRKLNPEIKDFHKTLPKGFFLVVPANQGPRGKGGDSLRKFQAPKQALLNTARLRRVPSAREGSALKKRVYSGANRLVSSTRPAAVQRSKLSTRSQTAGLRGRDVARERSRKSREPASLQAQYPWLFAR